MLMLQTFLFEAGSSALVCSTDALGVAPEQVEAMAFAWLAQQFCLRRPGNLPVVTGAKGRVFLVRCIPHKLHIL
jgi:anhydro-N-acetylmuramic acid kinase